MISIVKIGLGILRYFYLGPYSFVKVDAKSTLGQAILGLCMVELLDPHHSQCRIRSCSWPEHRFLHLTERLKWAKECEDCKGKLHEHRKTMEKTTRQISTISGQETSRWRCELAL